MAAITTAAIGVGMAGFQMYQGAKQQKEAKNALNNYNRQDLDSSNPFQDISISTVGSDVMREESQRASANAIEAARNMGSRGAAMLPAIIAGTNRANMESRAYLDDQIVKRDYAIANDNQNIRSLKEEREIADLAGIGNQMQVGQQNMWSGMRGMGTAAMSFANNYSAAAKTPNPQVESVNYLKPAGLVSIPSNTNISTPGFDLNKIYKPNPLY